ncbi:transposase [Leisingera methylohalidivorans]|uniref:transposase n=1 Tax=Leisingera methylohalidivorans TaxID=133924 RepID=UPI003CCBB87B
MTIPAVGPVTAVAFASTIDIPACFRNSRTLRAVLGLTPMLHQSGESRRAGRMSQCGDTAVRALLYKAA